MSRHSAASGRLQRAGWSRLCRFVSAASAACVAAAASRGVRRQRLPERLPLSWWRRPLPHRQRLPPGVWRRVHAKRRPLTADVAAADQSGGVCRIFGGDRCRVMGRLTLEHQGAGHVVTKAAKRLPEFVRFLVPQSSALSVCGPFYLRRVCRSSRCRHAPFSQRDRRFRYEPCYELGLLSCRFLP